MKKTLGAAAFSLLCVAGAASADPLALPADTPIYFQFNNLEQVNAANNLVVPNYAPAAAYGNGLQGNWGVFNISSVQTGATLAGGGYAGAIVPPLNGHWDIGGGPTFFADDGAGGTAGQITGIFYGVDFTSPTTAVGGVVDLYWHDAGTDTITADCLAGNTCLPDAATVGQFTSGTFLARLVFQSGVIQGDNTTTLSSTTNPAAAQGQAEAFASVDLSATVNGKTGAWASILDGNWFNVDTNGNNFRGDAGEARDVRFSTFFNPNLFTWNGAPGSNTVGLRSNDPARVFTAPVPEPASLTLLGLGLAGFAARRRKAAQNRA